MPIVAMNLPEITIINSEMNNYQLQSNSIYEKNVMPRYPKTKASTAYDIIENAIDVTCLA